MTVSKSLTKHLALAVVFMLAVTGPVALAAQAASDQTGTTLTLDKADQDQAVRFAMACAELTLSSTFANAPDLSMAVVMSRLEPTST